MCTKPETIAAALLDSPVGDLERRWDKDTIATVLTMYWAIASIGTSFHQYYDYEKHNTLTPVIDVPAAVTLASEPMFADFPRSLADRLFADLRHWSTPGRGGHFIAHEEPQLMADEIRSFFHPLSQPANPPRTTPGQRLSACP